MCALTATEVPPGRPPRPLFTREPRVSRGPGPNKFSCHTSWGEGRGVEVRVGGQVRAETFTEFREVEEEER